MYIIFLIFPYPLSPILSLLPSPPHFIPLSPFPSLSLPLSLSSSLYPLSPFPLSHPHKTLPALVFLVQHTSIDVAVDACWALSFLADGNTKQIQVCTHVQYMYVVTMQGVL